MDPRALTALFMLMNVLFFILATWLSYEAHDEDPDFQHWEGMLRRREKALAKARRRREKNLKRRQKDAELLVETAQQLILEYRGSNIASRENKTRPAVWSTSTPEALINIGQFGFRLKDNESGTGEKP
jgi:hypothetical protein